MRVRGWCVAIGEGSFEEVVEVEVLVAHKSFFWSDAGLSVKKPIVISMGLRVCKTCKNELEESSFKVRLIRGKPWRHVNCEACVSKYTREYMSKRRKDPEFLERNRVWRARCYEDKSPEKVEHRKLVAVKRKYGISAEQFREQAAKQSGRCLICGEEVGLMRLFVDHCHHTNIFRGLLCNNCNSGIGMLRDKTSNAINAAKYLSGLMSEYQPSYQFICKEVNGKRKMKKEESQTEEDL